MRACIQDDHMEVSIDFQGFFGVNLTLRTMNLSKKYTAVERYSMM